jgi:hypothetical protein
MAQAKMTQEEIIQQEVARQNAIFLKQQQQREENIVSMGARVVEKRVHQGSPIIDKQTSQQKIDAHGVPQCYPDKFFVTLQFMGGELEKEVTPDKYDELEELKMYYCQGYIGEVKRFGNSFIEPIFTKFTKI